MRAKTIKLILKNKFNHWLKSIDSDEMKKIIRENAIITGGSIASMLLGEDVNDYDVYFKTKESVRRVAEYYVERFKQNPPSRFKDNENKVIPIEVVENDKGRISIIVKSAGIVSEEVTTSYQYFEQVTDDTATQEFVDKTMQDAKEANEKSDRPKYRPVFLTSNAITLADDIQIVIRFYGPVNEIHENYDFEHCKCSWDAKTNELILPPSALEALLARELRYTHSKYPLCSLIRTRKFLRKEWHIHAGQYVKMAWDLNELDLSDPDVLREQMIGVDSAYFGEVLSLLKARDAEKVDGTYLMEVIDKVFD